ncbi:hypothetical protein ANO14919_084320 [Xylariales sp. No.14919]|nr:hypothetical protein ANO14919_084320 [Xylariales sp. No.14919]
MLYVYHGALIGFVPQCNTPLNDGPTSPGDSIRTFSVTPGLFIDEKNGNSAKRTRLRSKDEVQRTSFLSVLFGTVSSISL